MTRFIKKWLLINYCGQKIGQFSSNNIIENLNNVLISQILSLLFIPISLLSLKAGVRNIFVFSIILILTTFLFRKFFISQTKRFIKIDDLKLEYDHLSRSNRIFYFIIAIILTGGSIFIFGLSFYFYQFIK
jgi:hypothetical protein